MKSDERIDPAPLETDFRESLPLCNTSTFLHKSTIFDSAHPQDSAPISTIPRTHSIPIFSTHHRQASTDATLMPESFPILKKEKTIRPDSEIKQWWDVGHDIMILYSLCTTMYYLAYEFPGNGMFAMDVCVWVFFVADMFVTSNTAFFSPDHELVFSRKAIILRYFRSWLLPDVLSLLPFSFAGLPSTEYYLRLLRFLRLPSSLTFGDGKGLGKVFGLMVRHLPEIKFGDFRVSYYYVTLISQQIVRMITLSYVLACIFYWFAKHTGPEHVYTSAWFDDSAHLTDQSGSTRFLHSFYFMLTTLMTIGYGDFLPLSFCERMLMIVFLGLGIANFSLIMGSFVSLISDLNELNSSSSLHTQASIWMESLESAGQHLPSSLKLRVIEYFAHYGEKDRLGSLAVAWWQAESVEELTQPKDEMFIGLKEGEKRAILDHLFGDVFIWYRSFLGAGRCCFAYDIAFHFQPRFFPINSFLLEEHSEAEEVTLILHGSISCEFTHNSAPHPFLTFTDRLAIGDYSVLTGTKAKTSFRAVGLSGVEAFAVPKRPLLDLLEARYGGRGEGGYCHKAEIIQKAAMFDKTVESAKMDYMRKNRLEKGRRMTDITLKMSFRLIKLSTQIDPALKYESLVSPIIETNSLRAIRCHNGVHKAVPIPAPQ